MSKLKEIRERRGVTAEAVARHLGIVRQTYYAYEKDPQRMTVEQARAVCAFLCCNVGDIFFSDEVSQANRG